jgi:hypothetical protein
VWICGGPVSSAMKACVVTEFGSEEKLQYIKDVCVVL